MEVNINFVTFLTENIEEVQFVSMVVENSTSITFLMYHIWYYLQKVQFTFRVEH